MVQNKILFNRLYNLGLTEKTFTSVSEVVVQCQDYNAGKWAIGLRIKNSTEKKISDALQSENIIRTHVLRPTWHFVHKDDIRWMLDLSTPQIKKNMSRQEGYRDLKEETFRNSRNLLISTLDGGVQMKREEIKELLLQSKTIPDVRYLGLVLMDAEIHQVICNGTDMKNQVTYRLFDEKIPDHKTLNRTESVEKLVGRYFTSHGPATLQDFARWSGLSITEIKKGINDLQERGEIDLKETNDYWYNKDLVERELENCNYLLPRYDEYLICYKDNKEIIKVYNNKLAEDLNYNAIIEKGRIIGKWTRNISKKEVTIKYEYFKKPTKKQEFEINEKSKVYAKFIEKTLIQ